MLVDINKVKVNERIRKDFGDIAELANDIKENGLINPPVVTPDYELIAGERRLRAMKSLGYEQIEVRVMTVQDALHQLKLEISENENRKDFTFSEKMRYGEQLREEYEKIAKQNMSDGGKGCSNEQTLNTRKKVAEGIGVSDSSLQRMEYVYQNATEEQIRELDENKLSINAAYRKLKDENTKLAVENTKMKEKEKLYQRKTQELNHLNDELMELQRKLEERPVIEKAPEDYADIKKYFNDYKSDYERLCAEFESKTKEVNNLKSQIKAIKDNDGQVDNDKRLKNGALLFAAGIDRFIQDNGGLYWVSDYINDLPDAERKLYIQAIERLEAWVVGIKNNINDKLLNN